MVLGYSKKLAGVMKMINRTFKLFLFLIAYTPMFFLVALLFFETLLGLVMTLVILVSIVGFMILVTSAWRNAETKALTFVGIEPNTVRLMDYMVLYLVPFVLPEDILLATLGLAVILVISGAIYTNSDLIGINPVLLLFGYRVFKVYFATPESMESGEFPKAWLIARELNENMEVKELSKELYLGL
jgi:hypothetical protein